MVTCMTALSGYDRIIVKVGSALLVQDGKLRNEWLNRLCHDIATLKAKNIDVLIVSSGAIALGRQVLNMGSGSLTLPQKQACAAAGQSGLTRAYDLALSAYGLQSAQALLTLDDTENRRKWLNARATIGTLLSLDVIPIINENDTVATAEIRYGDNDRLAARTAQMVEADLLILLSDIDGLYTADPRLDTTAQHVPVVEKLSNEITAMGGPPNIQTGLGSGGMATKLMAARIAMNAGCDMIICDGRPEGALGALGNGTRHTLFKASENPGRARAQWISGSLSPAGKLHIDQGAASALKNGRSLLAVGLTSVSGSFGKGDTVSILDPHGGEIARGLCSYDSRDIESLCGLTTEQIDHPSGAVVVHRDNLVLT
ncbi:MAG: glutamate 5-kinase [Pseudomonadota bacterium]